MFEDKQRTNKKKQITFTGYLLIMKTGLFFR